MSNDARVTKDLIETLRDGEKGFAAAADKLADSTRPDIASEFRRLSQQRATFANELDALAAAYGDDIDESGSAAAAVHRAWMAVKDTLTGADPDGVLDVAEQGEDHAVAEYDKAMKEDISDGLREILQRQYRDVRMAHDRVRDLRDAA